MFVEGNVLDQDLAVELRLVFRQVGFFEPKRCHTVDVGAERVDRDWSPVGEGELDVAG